jgi:hypothetical protein
MTGWHRARRRQGRGGRWRARNGPRTAAAVAKAAATSRPRCPARKRAGSTTCATPRRPRPTSAPAQVRRHSVARTRADEAVRRMPGGRASGAMTPRRPGAGGLLSRLSACPIQHRPARRCPLGVRPSRLASPSNCEMPNRCADRSSRPPGATAVRTRRRVGIAVPRSRSQVGIAVPRSRSQVAIGVARSRRHRLSPAAGPSKRSRQHAAALLLNQRKQPPPGAAVAGTTSRRANLVRAVAGAALPTSRRGSRRWVEVAVVPPTSSLESCLRAVAGVVVTTSRRQS